MAKRITARNFVEEYVFSIFNGDFKTNQEFYDFHEIPQTTFYSWVKKYREEIDAEISKQKDTLRSVAMQALRAKFSKSDPEMDAIKTALKMTGDLVDRSENKTTVDGDISFRIIRLPAKKSEGENVG